MTALVSQVIEGTTPLRRGDRPRSPELSGQNNLVYASAKCLKVINIALTTCLKVLFYGIYILESKYISKIYIPVRLVCYMPNHSINEASTARADFRRQSAAQTAKHTSNCTGRKN